MIVSLALVMLAVGCVPQLRILGGGEGPSLQEAVRLSPKDVAADLEVVGDATEILRESADDSLEAAGMTCEKPDDGCPSIDLRARILEPSKSFSQASPPIRIVELIADYAGKGLDAPSYTLSYQRTVALDGNLSTATWMRISDALMNDLAADFSFRSRASGIVLRLPAWANRPTEHPELDEPRSFHVAVTGDARSDPDTIGTVDGIEVRLARGATDFLTEMITDDLRGTGHTIVPARDGRLVGTQLEKFWIESVKRSSGWETTASIELSLEVAPPEGERRQKAALHSCETKDESRRVLGEADLAQLLESCLEELMSSMRADPAWDLGLETKADPENEPNSEGETGS